MHFTIIQTNITIIFSFNISFTEEIFQLECHGDNDNDDDRDNNR